jgi:hypothetical protein
MARRAEGTGLSGAVYIAGKGFYSTANAVMLEERNLRYSIPVRRDNRQIDYSPLEDGEFKAKNGRFAWQGRIIRYYQYAVGGAAPGRPTRRISSGTRLRCCLTVTRLS